MKPPRQIITVLAVLALASLACSAVTRLRATPIPPTATPAPTATGSERQLETFTVIWETVRDQYVRDDYDGVDWDAVGETYRAQVEAGLDDEAFTQAMRDMLAQLPPGAASIQTRAERLELETTTTSEYQGIGAFISFRTEPEPHIVILAIIKGSPAEKAGLKAHDGIYRIDGEAIGPDEANTVVNRVRGPAGSSVTLTVQTPGEERRDVTIARGTLTAGDVVRGGYREDLGIAYYRMPVFPDPNFADIIAQTLLTISGTTDFKGLILDMRVSTSGQGWPLGQMLTLLGNGDLGEFYGRDGAETLTIEGQDIGGSQTIPLVILIGPDTEGNAEIFAGALHGARRAVLLGLPTPGQVQQFSEIQLPDGGRLFLATSSFRTPDGVDLSTAGLQPDIQVDADWDQITEEDDPVLDAAVELLLK
jgi:C-terminal peptidase prc